MALVLPSTTVSFDPGTLASQGSGDAYKAVVHLGTSSSGTANVLKKLGSSSEIDAFFGNGPTPRSMKHYLKRLKLPQFGIRAATSASGACGDTRYAASFDSDEEDPPNNKATISYAGSSGGPYDDYEIVTEVTLGGVVGTAQAHVSIDGGNTWGDEFVITGTTFVIPGIGVTATIDNDPNTSLAVDSCWFCRTMAPQMSVAGLTAALNALSDQTEEQFGMVMVLQGWEKDDLEDALAAAETAALAGEENLNLYSVFLSFRRQDVTGQDGFGDAGDPETEQEWKEDAADLDFAGGLKVLKSFGEYRIQDTVSGTFPRRLALEQHMLVFNKSSFRQEQMELSLGPIPEVKTSFYSEAKGDLLYPRKWIVGRKHPRYTGEYVAAGLMSTPVDSEMVYFFVRQICHQIQERLQRFAPNTYGKLTRTVDGQLTQESANFWADRFRNAAVSLIDGKSLIELTVDCTDSTVEDATVQLSVKWDALIGTPIGAVNIQGSFTVG
jgi:hypothetical protein